MTQTGQPDTLTPDSLAEGLKFLAAADPYLAGILSRLGPPPLWAREPGFPTLVHIILEQQVSLASARAAFTKLLQSAGVLSPETFLKYNDTELKSIGFSRQKASYCRALAGAILAGDLDIPALSQFDDSAARTALLKLKGVGPWTADIYLLMVLMRPNIWPSGDLALAVAIQELKELSSRPSVTEMIDIACPWQPWRAVAARQLWQNYIHRRGLLQD